MEQTKKKIDMYKQCRLEKKVSYLQESQNAIVGSMSDLRQEAPKCVSQKPNINVFDLQVVSFLQLINFWCFPAASIHCLFQAAQKTLIWTQLEDIRQVWGL